MSGPDLSFDPLAGTALAGWLDRVRVSYVAERVTAGDSAAEAQANVEASLARLFPDGSPRLGQLVGRILAEGRPVGALWLGPIADDHTRW